MISVVMRISLRAGRLSCTGGNSVGHLAGFEGSRQSGCGRAGILFAILGDMEIMSCMFSLCVPENK